MNTLTRFFLLMACLLTASPSLSAFQQRSGHGGIPAAEAADTTINVAVTAKWNMISVPLIVADVHKDTLFPTSISSAFRYDAGYVTEDELVGGRGYWLKFDTAETIPLFGAAVHRDTFDVVAGWNMIGSISQSVDVGAVTTIPGDMTLSNFWEYATTYLHASSIMPGGGYWVKTSSAGSIILDDAAAASAPRANTGMSGLHKLTLEDARGMKQTLWFGESGPEYSGIVTEMPPPPPPGLLDVRFTDGGWVEFYGNGGGHTFAVSVASAAYPVTLRWEMAGEDRREVVLNETIRMTGTGSVVLEQKGPIEVRVGLSGIPSVYALRQNYPNPFNPATTIGYDLPEAAPVKLAVYDLLGRRVAVLAEGVTEAGSHTAVFDAAGLPSGVYFYRLEAGTFTDSRKLMVLR